MALISSFILKYVRMSLFTKHTYYSTDYMQYNYYINTAEKDPIDNIVQVQGI